MTKNQNMELTRLQGAIAIASFASGVSIAAVCLFFIKPYGEISSSAITIVSVLLMMAGGLLGLKTSYDMKLQKLETDLQKMADKTHTEL